MIRRSVRQDTVPQVEDKRAALEGLDDAADFIGHGRTASDQHQRIKVSLDGALALDRLAEPRPLGTALSNPTPCTPVRAA